MSLDIREIKKLLDQIEEDLVARVPEHLFAAHVLPLLAGDPGHTSLEPWLHLAGSPFNKMAVHDVEGRVLFTVPAMSVSPDLSKDRDARNSLFEIMNNYELRSKISPLMARNYLDAALGTKMTDRSFNYQDLEAVDDILERYGRKRRLPKELYESLKRSGTVSTVDSSTPSGEVSVGDEAGDDL